MKTLIITLLMLYIYFFLLGHQQEMHQHITRESFQLLRYSFPEDFTGLNELAAYLGTDEVENIQEDPVVFNSVGALKVVGGSWFEDEYDMVYHYGTYRVPDYNNMPPWFEELVFSEDFNRAAHTTITHFWNADFGEDAPTHLNDALEYGDFSINWEFTISKNALKKIRKYINGEYESRWLYSEPVEWSDYGSCTANDFDIPPLLDLYSGNGVLQAVSCLIEGDDEWHDTTAPVLDFPASIRKGIVYNLLGRMCHLLQDMSVPAHAHNTSHAGIYGMYFDIFESNEMDYFNEISDWSAFDVYMQYGELIDPYVHEDPIYYLSYFLDQIADFFPDGEHAGDSNYDSSIPGLIEVFETLENDLQPNELNSENCVYMYNVLIPYAIRATAGLLYWFAVESGQIDPIPQPWDVTGQVVTCEGEVPEEVSVIFDKINSSNDHFISAEPDGSFSRQFCYREAGIYDIEIRKDGYYPTIMQNINILEDPDLGEIILEPIYSQEYVMVSPDNELASYNNIRDAVEYLQRIGGGSIYVHPGIYSGAKNRNITWLPVNTENFQTECHIRIRAFEEHTAILDCEGLSSAFILDNDDFGFSYSSEDEISGLIIRNAPQAIRIENGNPLIINNIFEDCIIFSDMENAHGAGIFCLSGAVIKNNVFDSNIGNWNGDDFTTYTYGGGIYISNNTSDPVEVIDNQILNCSAQEGGAIYCTGTGPIRLYGNLINSNSLQMGQGYNNYPGDCEGIACINCNGLELKHNIIIKQQKAEINGGNGVMVINSNDVMIQNNTISNNDQMIGIRLTNNTTCFLQNNIITDNLYGVYCWSGSSPELDYSNVWNNELSDISGVISIGENCINEDPCFVDAFNNNYDLVWDQFVMSPCIDSGSPELYDEDGTPSDMGANSSFWHDHNFSALGGSDSRIRYRWISFPVLDRNITSGATEPESILSDLLNSDIDWIRILSEDSFLNWTGASWEGEIVEFCSEKGYKIQIPQQAELSISGYKLPDNTAIHLEPDTKNWVGYFVSEPQGIFTALASIWDYLISIASEDWFYVKNGAYPPERCSMIYGKMYIIEVEESCELILGQSDDPVLPRERDLTGSFSYQETPQYAALVIDDIGDFSISEIGVFLDEECIGASVVEDFPLQILAFLPENTRGEGDVSFSFFTNNRNFREPENIFVLNEALGKYLRSAPILEPFEMISVRFEEVESQILDFSLNSNHPNPFNPTTSIEYSISEENNVKLQVYNLKGQLVKNLISEFQERGTYKTNWDGKDDNNNDVSSGIYLYRLTSGKSSETRKMVLLK
ncbi:T9SS type A sorting domain-containing protein [Candidatus Cloacimonadota bacterium]